MMSNHYFRPKDKIFGSFIQLVIEGKYLNSIILDILLNLKSVALIGIRNL